MLLVELKVHTDGREAPKYSSQELWRGMAAGGWHDVRELFSADIEACMPQLRERVVGAANFVRVLQQDLNRFEFQFLDSYDEYDRWDWSDHVTLELLLD